MPSVIDRREGEEQPNPTPPTTPEGGEQPAPAPAPAPAPESGGAAPAEGGTTTTEKLSGQLSDIIHGDKASGGSLQSYWTNLIQKGFIGEGTNQVGAGGEEVVDIVTEYQWITNKPTETGKKDNYRAVPCVYVVEYYQKHGATAMNFMNSIWAIKNAGKSILGNASGIFGKITKSMGEALESFSGGAGTGNSLMNKFTNTLKSIGTDADNFGKELNSGDVGGLLKPYEHLYSLETTKKKFCFPYFGEGSAAWSLSNDFSSDGSKSMISKALTEGIDTFAKGLIDLAGDIQEINNVIGNARGEGVGLGGFVMYNLEKAKAFSFPTSGKSISIRFPLYNTTKLDAWKDNYKFIVLFGFRNMLFRKDNVQYYPPMIYDVTIPGWGRLPFSYVRQFTVKPVGMIRPLMMDNFVASNGIGANKSKILVNVPEAWIIQIDFMSLIADSGNQFLSSLIDLPITVAQ